MKRLTLFSLLLMVGLLTACRWGAESVSPEDSEPTIPAGETAVAPSGTAPVVEPTSGGAGGATGGEETPAPPTPFPTVEPTAVVEDEMAGVDPTGQSIVLWHPFSGEREAALVELVETFNSSNEQGITITAENVGGRAELISRLSEEAGAGGLPALVVASRGEALVNQLADALVDLAPYAASEMWGIPEEARSDSAGALAALDVGTTDMTPILSAPVGYSTDVLYYNADLLNSVADGTPPTTWEQLGEMACAAAGADNTGLLLDYRLDGIDSSRFASIVFSHGGELMAEGDSAFDLDSPEAVEAMAFLQQLYERGCISTIPGRTDEPTTFGEGTILFTIDSTSRLPLYSKVVEEGYGGEWGVAPLPAAGEEPAQNVSSSSALIFQGAEEQQLAAWLFVRWLMEPEQQAQWARGTGELPVRASAASEIEEYASAGLEYETFSQWLQSGKSEPAPAEHDIIRLLVDEAMLQIVEGADVEQTLADLEEEINALGEGQ